MHSGGSILDHWPDSRSLAPLDLRPDYPANATQVMTAATGTVGTGAVARSAPAAERRTGR
ncbi:hypothetical protein WDH52_22945 [Streptomyces sp. TRM70308]|uniref:hypothetical protein n=1 Tax=Streptomyces sp. TRM70308 TaxID=3131932 RepID=UPI003D038820